MQLTHFQWYPDGGTFVVPDGVTIISTRDDLPLDFNPITDKMQPEHYFREREVSPGQTITLQPRQQVAWVSEEDEPA